MLFSKKFIKFNKLNHCFFSKKNGFSSGVYSSLNCGYGSNDRSENIRKNIEYVSRKIKIKSKDLVLMNQTHSNNVALVTKKNQSELRFKSDALVTDLVNVGIGVLTADCVPILLYDEVNQVIACIHAGWKGAFSNIINKTINKINLLNPKNRITAAVGPCIGKNNYEVQTDFYKKFLHHSSFNEKFFFHKNMKIYFDIRKYVNYKLNLAGIENIDNINEDTFENSKSFFSYRRSQKAREADYGRCISTICLKT
jgi:YfiH family protein